MRKSVISLALSDISDEFVLEAAQPKRRSPALPIFAAAACVCLVLLGVFALRGHDPSGIAPQPPINGGLIVTSPLVDKDIGSPVNETSMISFFIYDGRSYVAYSSAPATLQGDYLGTSRASIDEGSSPTNYVELSGSIGGDFYAVNGYDPTFMLCKEWTDDKVMLYIINNGLMLSNDLTLGKGEELFDTRLRMDGDYASVMGQTRYDWSYSTEQYTDLTTQQDVINTFVAALKEGTFVLVSDILPEGVTSVYDSLETHHLFITKSDGVKVHLRLFDGGYVQFGSFLDVCVQMDKAAFDAVTALIG